MNDRIAWFDMDGSLFDFDGHMRESLVPLCSSEEKQLVMTTGLWELEEASPQIKARMELIKAVPGWWRTMPPLETGFTVFRMAQSIGFDCRILTKGPKSVRRPTGTTTFRRGLVPTSGKSPAVPSSPCCPPAAARRERPAISDPGRTR